MNLGGRSFTGFRNILVRGESYVGGTVGGSPGGGAIYFTSGATNGGVPGGTGAWDATIAIATFSGATSGAANTSTTNEAPYLSIANLGLNLGTGFIRMVTGAQAGTVSIGTATNDQDKAWVFPNKSGTFGISGTFAANLPAIAATSSTWSTVVTVSGIRVEDGLVVTQSNQGVTAGYNTFSTAKILQAAVPGNGNITLNFVNLGAATGYTEAVFSYTAVR